MLWFCSPTLSLRVTHHLSLSLSFLLSFLPSFPPFLTSLPPSLPVPPPTPYSGVANHPFTLSQSVNIPPVTCAPHSTKWPARLEKGKGEGWEDRREEWEEKGSGGGKGGTVTKGKKWGRKESRKRNKNEKVKRTWGGIKERTERGMSQEGDRSTENQDLLPPSCKPVEISLLPTKLRVQKRQYRINIIQDHIQ